MDILIKNGRIIDPDTKLDEKADLYIEDGKIADVQPTIRKKAKKVIDARGCYVMPGLIDMHVHLRDPGQTHKEDVETGSKAAAKGGFTTIVAMPNTKPVIDEPTRVSYVINKALQCSPIHVLQTGAITKGQKGEELADLEGMIRVGIPALSEDGKTVMNSHLYLEAMKIAAQYDIPILAHCEDINMANGGCLNDDEVAKKLGLPGISNSVEDVIIARDIFMSFDTGCRLHLCHCSTKNSELMMRNAKEDGQKVTAEVCPHHFTLTSEDIKEGNSNYKMNPPLRTKEDVDALKQGLKDDVFDVISTDHAPHRHAEKSGSMRDAPFGIVGLETCVALTISELVKPGVITPMQMAEKMSYNPARILKLENRGSLAVGKEADVVIIDPNAEYIIDACTFVSKSKNTPFHGRKVNGEVRYTICGGKIVYEAK
ncbi:dihydroorotase [Ruminococcus sp. OA3]|uniref:dihydroorotase n=1 Tax=Ruminococcus sp. OA3 TaxID=2914164 RepID=UPI001F055FA6|nr:dihydroorotase [Ruminococcus sp. OA3]MCH1982590.1 dihydroorotase [Ruminococcus sp. OA3]